MDPKVYVVLGGSSPGVFARPPFLSHATSSPIMPIIIKCTSVPEANAAAGLQKVFNKLDCQNAEGNPEAFAVALAQSNQISDLFATQGPFYAVYNGKSERAIYVRDFSAVEAQVHDHLFAKHHRFESIKDALAYMVLKGNLAKMKELGLYTSKSGSLHIPNSWHIQNLPCSSQIYPPPNLGNPPQLHDTQTWNIRKLGWYIPTFETTLGSLIQSMAKPHRLRSILFMPLENMQVLTSRPMVIPKIQLQALKEYGQKVAMWMNL
ncbi:hypothetical protein C8R43DRAFT_192860 [Mycena crocata]|nr:hypothetical protein C8R43DRAFT_192860 [Mycena crocata]